MEKTIKLLLQPNGTLASAQSAEDRVAGFQSENEATTLEIELCSAVAEHSHFIEILNPDGETVSSGALTASNGKISLALTSNVIKEQGRYYVQYVGRKDGKTVKSAMLALDVEPSINATEDLEEDEEFADWVVTKIQEIEAALGEKALKDEQQDQKDEQQDTAIGDNNGVDEQQATKIGALERDMGTAQEDIASAKTRLTALEGSMASQSYSGVIFYGASTRGVRVGAASGLTSLADIKRLPVFRSIRTFVGQDGHHKWSVDKFYVKHVSNASEGYVPGDPEWYEGWYVAESKLDEGYFLLPAFSLLGKEKIIIGKYKAGVEGVDEEHGTLVSKPGLSPVNNYSPEMARDHMPTGAHSMHFFEKQAIDILMWISTGCRDLQREFYKGDCFDPYMYPTDYDWLNSSNSPTVYFPVSDLLEWTAFSECEDADDIIALLPVGTVMTIWNDDEGTILDTASITAITTEDVYNENDDENVSCIKITFDKTLPMEDYYIALLGSTFITGATDSVEGDTGEETTSMPGCRHFKWYGLEDIYGCVYEWLEGVALVGIYDENLSTQSKTKTHVKYCVDPAYYDEANYNDGNAGAMSHWLNALEFDSKNGGYVEEYKETSVPGLFVPYSEQSAGDDATFYADSAVVYSIWANSSNPVQSYLFYSGGDFGGGYDAGPSQLDGYGSTSTYGDIGFRLSYDEE